MLKQKMLKSTRKRSRPNFETDRPQYIIKVLNEKIADNAVISLDVGENCWVWPQLPNEKDPENGYERTLATMDSVYLGISGCVSLP